MGSFTSFAMTMQNRGIKGRGIAAIFKMDKYSIIFNIAAIPLPRSNFFRVVIASEAKQLVFISTV